MKTSITFFVFVSCFIYISCFSTGVPKKACNTKKPFHIRRNFTDWDWEYAPQFSKPPFRLLTNVTMIKPGDYVEGLYCIGKLFLIYKLNIFVNIINLSYYNYNV